MKALLAFVGGALAGAAVALLYAPAKGEDLRAQIKDALLRKGHDDDDRIDELVAQIAAEIESESK